MKKYLLIFVLMASTATAQLPDSVKIMWQHSSIGQRIMNARQEVFKSRVDSLGQAYGWPIGLWDYRTNTNPADEWAGWRTARFDSSTHKSGWVIGDIYGCSSDNMWLHHLTAMWNDTSSYKSGILDVDTVYDADAEPDTLVDITDFNCLWFLPAYWHWGNNEADSLASYRNQALAWRDSAALYPGNIFVYIMQVPIKLGGYVASTYSYSEAEKANAFALDKFWRDTLQDTSTYPNFMTWSFFDVLVEKSPDSTRYAYIQSKYEGTDDHPNATADTLLQDSMITAWMPRLLEYAEDYFTGDTTPPVKRIRRLLK